MWQGLTFVSPHNSDDTYDIPNIIVRDEAKHTVAEALMGMGQGLPDDNKPVEEVGELREAKASDEREVI